MVLGNVPKLHAFIALLGGAIAVPIGCSGDDFQGCEATRTCPSKGGTSGTGGEAGDGNDTGGRNDTGGSSSSGSSGTTGSSGAAGTDNGGEAGTGGTTDDTDPPTIVSFSPDDGDVDVERDVAVTATFSEVIDATSVTATTVVLTGPDGDVPGAVNVDGEVVSFVPERKLYLLGEYTLTIGDGVADLAGNTLGQEASVEFRVRDGRWGIITRPFGSTPREMGRLSRNAAGDVVMAGGLPTLPSTRLWAARYSANENAWSPAATLSLAEAAYFPSNGSGLDIDPVGRVAMSWFTSTTAGWYRATDDGSWDDVGALPSYSIVAMTSDGEATAISFNSSTLSSRSLDIQTGVLGPITPMWSSNLETLTDFQAVGSLERIALFERTSDGTGDQITVAWRDPTTGWSSQEQIASSGDISGVWAAQGDGEGNIVIVWIQGTQIWSRVYHQGRDQWTRATPVFAGSTTPSFGYPRMAAGNVAMSIYVGSTVYAAYYQRDTGWIENSVIDLANIGVGDFWNGGFGVEMAIDRMGNMLAIGHTGSRRYVQTGGWQPVVEHALVLGPWRLWAVPASDGSILAITHDVTVNDETIPEVVRFE